jgi:hypothetical protein
MNITNHAVQDGSLVLSASISAGVIGIPVPTLGTPLGVSVSVISAHGLMAAAESANVMAIEEADPRDQLSVSFTAPTSLMVRVSDSALVAGGTWADLLRGMSTDGFSIITLSITDASIQSVREQASVYVDSGMEATVVATWPPN